MEADTLFSASVEWLQWSDTLSQVQLWQSLAWCDPQSKALLRGGCQMTVPWLPSTAWASQNAAFPAYPKIYLTFYCQQLSSDKGPLTLCFPLMIFAQIVPCSNSTFIEVLAAVSGQGHCELKFSFVREKEIHFCSKWCTYILPWWPLTTSRTHHTWLPLQFSKKKRQIRSRSNSDQYHHCKWCGVSAMCD